MRKLLLSITLLVVLAGIGGTAYWMGLKSARNSVHELEQEIAQLKEGEVQANITKRVSKQMEDIAYQQKEISDKQRIRAEQQSILAEENARRAQMESELAHEAEQRAMRMADSARAERQRAEEQQRQAEQQRDIATLQKNISDTLSYRRIANNLGTSALEQSSFNRDLSAILAYWSWYFNKNYNGNTYHSEAYTAMLTACGYNTAISTGSQASVCNITALPHGKGYAAFTNYGEVFISEGEGMKKIFFDKHYDLRSAQYAKGALYALSLYGPLLRIGRGQKTSVDSTALPRDTYRQLLKASPSVLVAVGERTLVYIESSKGTVQQTVALDDALSYAMATNRGVCLFYRNGRCEERNGEGRKIKNSLFPTEMAQYRSNPITSACMDAHTGLVCLGTQSGKVDCYNRYGRNFVSFMGNKGAILTMELWHNILVLGSYDHTVQLYNMPRLQFEHGGTLHDELVSPTPLAHRERKGVGSMWLVPAKLTYSGWPTSIEHLDGTNLAVVGFSNGSTCILNLETDAMAETLRMRYRGHDLNAKQWNLYVGSYVTYRTIE